MAPRGWLGHAGCLHLSPPAVTVSPHLPSASRSSRRCQVAHWKQGHKRECRAEPAAPAGAAGEPEAGEPEADAAAAAEDDASCGGST